MSCRQRRISEGSGTSAMKASSLLLPYRMISYLGINLSRELIAQDNMLNLLDLVGFAFVAAGLQVQDFHRSWALEDVVVPSGAFSESKAQEQVDPACEGNVGVGISSEDWFKKFFGSSHDSRSLTASRFGDNTGLSLR
jgi:hypothetical protein